MRQARIARKLSLRCCLTGGIQPASIGGSQGGLRRPV